MHKIRRNPKQPCGELSFLIKRMDIDICTHKSFLRYIFRFLCIAEHSITNLIQPMLKHGDNFFKCILIAFHHFIYSFIDQFIQ